MSIKNKITDSITDYLNLLTFGIVTVIVIAAAIMITNIGLKQSVNAQTSQDVYSIGYYSGCHDAPPSVKSTNMSYVHFSNTSNPYSYYNEGYKNGISDELNGLCSPDLLSQIYAGSNNDTNPFYIYESESMAPILHKGDLIVANYNNTNFNDSKFGNIIIFKATDPAAHNKIIAHRVIKTFQKGDVLAGKNSAFNNLCEPMIMPKINNIGKIIMTKGDANDCSIPLVDFPFTPKNHIGKVVAIGHK